MRLRFSNSKISQICSVGSKFIVQRQLLRAVCKVGYGNLATKLKKDRNLWLNLVLWLNFRGCDLKSKRIKFTTEAVNLSYQKSIFHG